MAEKQKNEEGSTRAICFAMFLTGVALGLLFLQQFYPSTPIVDTTFLEPILGHLELSSFYEVVFVLAALGTTITEAAYMRSLTHHENSKAVRNGDITINFEKDRAIRDKFGFYKNTLRLLTITLFYTAIIWVWGVKPLSSGAHLFAFLVFVRLFFCSLASFYDARKWLLEEINPAKK